MKLALFDFDNTLFKTPYDEDPDYMNKPESLFIRKWNFKPISETIKIFRKIKKDPKIKVILLTNRIDSVLDEVKKILKLHDLNFDFYEPIDGISGDRSKGSRVIKLLEKYQNVSEVEYWEDKDKHIEDVENVMLNYPKIKLKINKVII